MASPHRRNILPRSDLAWSLALALVATACGDSGSDTVAEGPGTGSATEAGPGTDTPPTTSATDDDDGTATATATDGDDTGKVDAEDPGRVTVHRLNRTEYNNTVRDLLGTSQRPADASRPTTSASASTTSPTCSAPRRCRPSCTSARPRA
jgi:hypothetical protein